VLAILMVRNFLTWSSTSGPDDIATNGFNVFAAYKDRRRITGDSPNSVKGDQKYTRIAYVLL
jgi:hypothetical protein